MREPEGFRDFVVARSGALVRHAWLLTGDRGEAEDLVQTALAKTWNRWARLDAPEAYVRRVIVTSFVSARRRRRAETAPGSLPDRPVPGDAFADADLRSAVRQALLSLPPRQRAVVVLRYFDDLTEAQTAQAMGCSVGTVKSQSAKALGKLRQCPLGGVWDEEASHG